MTKPQLNILFICNKSPWPASEGGPIAMNMLIQGLMDAGHRVKVLAVNSNKYTVDPEHIPNKYQNETEIEFAHIDLSIKPFEAFANLFSSKSYHVERFDTKAFREKLVDILKKNTFDIVQIETLYMSPYIEYIKEYSTAKIVLRAHNIEHRIWERITLSTKNPLKKAYLGHLSRTLKNYETNILNRYDGIVPISEVDARFFSDYSDKPILAIPFGIRTSNAASANNAAVENSLFHIGSMNWVPNEEGIKWFIHEAWPLITKRLPSIKLYLAGRGMPDWLKNLQIPNIEVIGEVPDAAEFIQSKSISIAALFSGSGIRIKIIESMALGKAVISTKIGAEGIHYTDGKNILIANTAEEFCKACENLYFNPTQAEAIGESARKLILEKHNSEKLIRELISFYQEIL